ncbi:MAG: helix-turn-helix domain-containing protein [Oscillospiraceae bacterium]|nr:helix-turn-helix domain-containing protein [Oscillospiraceae bacterium]
MKYRSVLLLYYFDDMSVSETAKTLGISESAVTTRLQRARKLLKDELERRNYNG